MIASRLTSGHSSTDATTSECGDDQTERHKAAFVCPYCGECTMEQFFMEGCPKQAETLQGENKILFPHLDMAGLNVADRIDLEDRLQFETREIKLHFAKLILNVIQLLEDLQIPLEKVKISILSLDAFTDNLGIKVLDEEDAQKIEAAKNLSEVFIALRKYISFFNYHIVEHIIDQHEAARDSTLLRDYLLKFHRFCQRNIFEIPENLFPSISRITAKVFALKCTEGVATLSGVNGVKGEIARIFSLRPAALQLCSIKRGCVVLHFLISAAVADHIFPVSLIKTLSLSLIRVRVLSCERVDQINKEEMK